MVNAVYPKWKEALLGDQADSALTGSGATGLYAVLVDTAAYTYNEAHQFYSSLSGITNVEKEITAVTFINGVVNGSDVTYTAVAPGPDINAIVLFRKNTGLASTWRLVCYLDRDVLGLPATPNGGDISINWNTLGIFSLGTPPFGMVAVDKILVANAGSYLLTGQPASFTRPLSDLIAGYTRKFYDNFASLSLRTGGYNSGTTTGYNDPTSKGIWAPSGHNYMGVQGYRDFGYGYFINPNYNWQTTDPTFPPLGMFDITSNGLVIRGSDQYPAIRALLPAIGSGSGSDAVIGVPNGSGGGTWYNNNGATTTAGGSVDSLPTPVVIASGGLNYADREYFASASAVSGATYVCKVQYNLGTSGGGYVFIDAGSGQSYLYWVGTTQGAIAGSSGTISGISFSTVGSHVELTFNITLNNTGNLTVGVGPNSTVAGQNITVYDVQLLSSVAQQVYLSGLLCTAQSMKIGIPYARRTRFTLNSANGSDWPAVWSLGERYNGNPSFPNHYEIDDFEWFGSDYTVRTVAQSTHISNGTTLTENGVLYDAGVTVAGGAQIETVVVHRSDFVYFYVNGVLTSTQAVPAGASATDLHHAILNLAIGLSWHAYPPSIGTAPSLTIRDIEILAPPSNTTGVFPPTPPVPVLTWGGGFAGGVIPHTTPNGTVVATLSGASSYSIIGTANLGVSGSNVVTSGTFSGPALAKDGGAHATNVSGTIAASLTTTKPNDYIFACLTTNSGPTLSVSGSTLGAFTLVARQRTVPSAAEWVDIWVAFSPSTLAGEVITATGTISNYNVLDVFGVSGSGQSSLVFDPGGPQVAQVDPISITTTNANTMVIAAYRDAVANPTAGSGFTLVSGADFALVEYKILSSAQTLSCTQTTGAGGAGAGVVCAVPAAAGGGVGSSINFYVRGLDGSGNPGIAPKLAATIT